MALNAYLDMKGSVTGKITGSVTQKGREGKIMVIAATHQVTSPRDSASGQATGKRMHKPFVITKELDQSTPSLYTLWKNDELITTWELQFWAPNPLGTASGAGVEIQDYSVKLTNAKLVDIRFTMPNVRDPELVKLKEYEEISFVYEKIEWIWRQGNKTSSDAW
jgi:type VI secretion system secreted protein Hcp